MSTLIIAEHNNIGLHSATYSALEAAKQLSQPVVVLVLGANCQSVAEKAASLSGVNQVLVIDSAVLEHQLPENSAPVIATIAKDFDYILAAATTFGKNILPRVAALLDVAQVSDVTQILSSDTIQHPVYAGNALETVKLLDDKKVLTIRTTAFTFSQEFQSLCAIDTLTFDDKAQNSSTFISQELTKSVRPELTSAKIVVSGGRGLQSAEKFQLVEQLADTLGAAIGASRAAVDAGFAPNDYQVGQTGKVVAPDLYIAIGISGAVQHIAGMKDAKVIVAINKDSDAPIFQIANYGLVGDLFELVPQLIEQLKQLNQ